jgi:hypothetical protein
MIATTLNPRPTYSYVETFRTDRDHFITCFVGILLVILLPVKCSNCSDDVAVDKASDKSSDDEDNHPKFTVCI